MRLQPWKTTIKDVTLRNWVVNLAGWAAALWMSLAPGLFGILGDLRWWYFALLSVPMLALQSLVLWRVRVAQRRVLRPVGRAVYVALALSWLCALGFGLTVPERVGGELISVAGHLGGHLWNEMAIALCNPLGIIAFATAVAALIFALAAGREARLSEDELLDAAEAEQGMVPHPLSGQ